MKVINYYDLKQLERIGVAKFYPHRIEWAINGKTWYRIFKSYIGKNLTK